MVLATLKNKKTRSQAVARIADGILPSQQVKWRHRSRDQFDSCIMPFPIGGPLEPSL